MGTRRSPMKVIRLVLVAAIASAAFALPTEDEWAEDEYLRKRSGRSFSKENAMKKKGTWEKTKTKFDSQLLAPQCKDEELKSRLETAKAAEADPKCDGKATSEVCNAEDKCLWNEGTNACLDKCSVHSLCHTYQMMDELCVKGDAEMTGVDYMTGKKRQGNTPCDLTETGLADPSNCDRSFSSPYKCKQSVITASGGGRCTANSVGTITRGVGSPTTCGGSPKTKRTQWGKEKAECVDAPALDTGCGRLLTKTCGKGDGDHGRGIDYILNRAGPAIWGVSKDWMCGTERSGRDNKYALLDCSKITKDNIVTPDHPVEWFVVPDASGKSDPWKTAGAV